jgi:hypothetical protein
MHISLSLWHQPIFLPVYYIAVGGRINVSVFLSGLSFNPLMPLQYFCRGKLAEKGWMETGSKNSICSYQDWIMERGWILEGGCS